MFMLKESSETILDQLGRVCKQLDPEQYSRKLAILSDASIGMHFRHVIEFFDCVAAGCEKGYIDYDQRERNQLLEQDPRKAFEKIEQLKKWVLSQTEDIPLALRSGMCKDENAEGIDVASSVNRELIYAIEHAIHHMAIIKIAFLNSFPECELDKDFGVAFSTLQYRENACAQ